MSRGKLIFFGKTHVKLQGTMYDGFDIDLMKYGMLFVPYKTSTTELPINLMNERIFLQSTVELGDLRTLLEIFIVEH